MRKVLAQPTGLAAAGVAVFCIVQVVVQGIWFDRTSSVTFDETFYANCALKTVQTGRIDHRFAEYGVAPLPVLICYGPPAWILGGKSSREAFQSNAGHVRIVSTARAGNSIMLYDLRDPETRDAVKHCLVDRATAWRTP